MSHSVGWAEPRPLLEEERSTREQTAVTLSEEDIYTLPEVLVQSTKKSESEQLQDVPTAISVYSGETIENRFAVNLTDVGQWAPNVVLQDVRTVPNTAGFTIRGMGNIASSPSIDPTVGVFVDGMYMGITQGALVNTFDVETVEILRGPQGTLFGRNVTGGAVVVRHRRPTGQLDARGRTIVSNNNGALWVQQDAVVEAPFTDTIATKLGFMYRFDEGYFDNIERDSRTGGGTTYLIRPQLRFTPTPDFEVFVIGEYQDLDGDGPVFAIQKDSPPPLSQSKSG